MRKASMSMTSGPPPGVPGSPGSTTSGSPCSRPTARSASSRSTLTPTRRRTSVRRRSPPTTGPPALLGRLVEDVGLEEGQDALVGVAPVLAPLPAVTLVVVPVDLVALALDLERLDHPLGHQRHDPLVLAAVEDEQRRLDPLGAIDRGAAPVGLLAGRVVGRAHHLVQVEPAGAIAVAIALGDLGVAVQVDPRAPQRR